mgnify:CR=1 FL=1
MISDLTQHYIVVHKKSTPYYPQANGLVESRNKTLKNILRKIVNENRTDSDMKLNSALWAYNTSFKTNVPDTSLHLAYGLEVIMRVKLRIPSLHIHVKERMREEAFEQIRL